MSDLRDDCEYLAEHLLGWELRYEGEPEHPQYGWFDPQLPKWMHSYSDWTYLKTGNGMLEIIEAMRDGKHGGWRAHLYINGDCMAAFSRDDDEYAPDSYITHAQRTGLTLPEAVIRAAVSALKENSDECV